MDELNTEAISPTDAKIPNNPVQLKRVLEAVLLSAQQPLTVGDRLAFLDMSHYTMVKTTTFNGIQHPAICTYEPETGDLAVARRFSYPDFRSRLS